MGCGCYTYYTISEPFSSFLGLMVEKGALDEKPLSFGIIGRDGRVVLDW